jgi:ketosteroid isomerase-like protein
MPVAGGLAWQYIPPFLYPRAPLVFNRIVVAWPRLAVHLEAKSATLTPCCFSTLTLEIPAMPMTFVMLLLLLFLTSAPASAQQMQHPTSGHEHTTAAIDSAAIAAVVNRFHEALAAGDSMAVLAMLTEDARILENGAIETREEYRAHHLPGDVAFAQAISSDRGPLQVTVVGHVGWVTSTSTTRGEFRGRAINSQGAELMVLTHTPEGWRISAIHWSSRALRS